MDAWLDGTYQLLLHFFSRETPNETYLLIALCVLLGALALSHISTKLGAIGAFYTTAILLTPLGLVLLVAAMAAPLVFGLDACWMPLAAAGLALLVVIVPLTVLFQKGGYVTALIAWTVTALVVGAVLTVEPMVRDGLKHYAERGATFEKHRIETEKFK
ncbi:MAG: hypothetical protein HOO88_05220 [Kiritimatiellaceae bacterium]|nr:hypothetical protein [Kiritimatiellaceae bacterium]